MPPLRGVHHPAGRAPPLRAARRAFREQTLLRVGSLFSGAGLCDLGLHWAGFKHQWFCEIDPFCRSVLARHWPGIPIYEDVTTLNGAELPPVDVLCGGFPCQDVSQGGKHAGIRKGTRSGLWLEYARLIGEMRPWYVIVENVRGLLARGIEIVLRDLASLGYDAEWEVLSAAALGAPHRRERVFVVAFPHGEGPDPEHRLLSPLQRIVGKVDQPCVVLDWRGIRIVGQSREAVRHAYPGPVLYRVDDGRAGRMDHPVNVPSVPRRVLPEWHRRLKVLGNGILPRQAYAVGACIMEREGLPVPPMPFDS